MPTVNINLTPEQARLVNKTAKERGFANRSEFFRALIRHTFFGDDFKKPAPQVLSLDEIKKKVIPILKKNDVEFAGVFGSYARGGARPDSDVDLLIRYKDIKTKSLVNLIGLENNLSEQLGKKVQLVTEGAVHPDIKNSIINDLIILYGQGPSLR